MTDNSGASSRDLLKCWANSPVLKSSGPPLPLAIEGEVWGGHLPLDLATLWQMRGRTRSPKLTFLVAAYLCPLQQGSSTVLPRWGAVPVLSAAVGKGVGQLSWVPQVVRVKGGGIFPLSMSPHDHTMRWQDQLSHSQTLRNSLPPVSYAKEKHKIQSLKCCSQWGLRQALLSIAVSQRWIQLCTVLFFKPLITEATPMKTDHGMLQDLRYRHGIWLQLRPWHHCGFGGKHATQLSPLLHCLCLFGSASFYRTWTSLDLYLSNTPSYICSL